MRDRGVRVGRLHKQPPQTESGSLAMTGSSLACHTLFGLQYQYRSHTDTHTHTEAVMETLESLHVELRVISTAQII